MINAKDRILHYLAIKGINKREFYLSTGLSNGFLDKTNNIGSDKIERIISTYPDMNLWWVISGKGKPIIDSSRGDKAILHHVIEAETAYNPTETDIHDDVNTPTENIPKRAEKSIPNNIPNGLERILNEPKIVTVDSQGNNNILFVPVKASAGYLTGYGDPEFIETLPTYRLPGFDHGTFRMFEISGSSMHPTLKNRDKIIGKWCTLDEIRDSYVHIIVTKHDGIVTKRTLNRIDRDGYLVLRSDARTATEYPDILLPPEEVMECWVGIGKMSRDLSGPEDIYKRVNDLEGRLALMEHLFKKG